MKNSNRRKFILGISTVIVSGMSKTALARLATPSQSAGPFYPDRLPLDKDNDLTHVAGKNTRAKGEISDMTGKIMDINGRPLKDMRIEIWQCDANGRYRHSRETGFSPMDDNFQGFGLTHSNAQGEYRFRTIKPVAYPGRTPHIHVAVFPTGESPFVTQLYVAGDKRNERDFLYNAIPSDKRHLVTAEFKPLSHDMAIFQAKFDIILHRREGTPVEKT